MTPEGRIKAKINKLIKELGNTVYKFMPLPAIEGRGAPGLDYYICAGGQWFAVEAKANEKELVTGRQIETMNQIRRAGGRVFVVYDDETVKELGEALHKKTRKSGTVEDISIHITNPAWRVRELLRSENQ
jgi:hypothetical protein